jgi:hypothetical protein
MVPNSFVTEGRYEKTISIPPLPKLLAKTAVKSFKQLATPAPVCFFKKLRNKVVTRHIVTLTFQNLIVTSE